MAAEKPDMEGKTILVTGANAGIGFATALGIAEQGAQVLMVCRSKERGAKARDMIEAETGNPSVHLLIADLSYQASIRSLAEEVKFRFDRLHALVNNAGIIPRRWTATQDGLELQFAVNHLAYFLLTNLLLDLLKAGAPARVVNLSSMVHSGAALDFEDLQSQKGKYNRRAVYGRTKLANILFTYELARKVENAGVTANALHPGIVTTNLLADIVGVPRKLKAVTGIASVGIEAGAKGSIYLATSSEVEGVSGKYFVRCKSVESSPASYDRDAASRLWQVSSELARL